MEVLNKRVQLAHGQIRKQTGLNQYTAEIGTIDSKNGFKWIGEMYHTDKVFLEQLLNAFDSLPDLLRMLELWSASEDSKERFAFHDSKLKMQEFKQLAKAVSEKLEL